MTATCDFSASPTKVLSNGKVRFYPWVSGFTKEIATYAWTFGDGGNATADCPIHQYPTVASPTSYNVSLTVTDVGGGTAQITKNNFITIELPETILAGEGGVGTDGTYIKTSVMLYDSTNTIVVNRGAWTNCHFILLKPKIVDSIDKIGTATFTILDTGDGTATEKSLLKAGVNVIMFSGQSISFSGIIRRCEQNKQNMWSSTTRVTMWDVECDSDLARLQKIPLDSTALPTTGSAVIDSPGNIARMILTPATGVKDTRGIIFCTGPRISFQLNSLTSAESPGNQYDKINTLREATNYDLRTRPNFDLYQASSITAGSGNAVFTISTSAWTVDALIGGYVVVVDRHKHDGTTHNVDGVIAYGKITDNTDTTITCTGTFVGTLDPDFPDTARFIVYNGYLVDFAMDLSQPSVINDFDVNVDVYEYCDNDDKRKLVTKAVVSGKDLQGITISVALSAVHAYNNDTQFFNDATFITKKSEGYIYKNNYFYAPDEKAVTVATSSPNPVQYYTTTDTTALWLRTSGDMTGHIASNIRVHIQSIFSGGYPINLYSKSLVYGGPTSGDNFITVRDTVDGSVLSVGQPPFYDHSQTCTAQNSGGQPWTYFYATNPNAYLAINSMIKFTSTTGSLPVGYSLNTVYYVVSADSSSFQLSDTPSGDPIPWWSGEQGSGTHTLKRYVTDIPNDGDFHIWTDGGMSINNSDGYIELGDSFKVYADVYPGGLSAGTTYYVGDAVNIATGQFFRISSTPGPSYTYVYPTTPGTNVRIYRTSGGDIGGLFGITDPTVWLYGWGFVIPDGTSVALSIPGVSAIARTTVGATTEGTDKNGTKYTQVHLNTMPDGDYSSKGYFLNGTHFVDYADAVSNYAVLMGEEPVTINSHGTDTTHGDYIVLSGITDRITSASKKCYPHGIGSLVARTNYTEASPQALSGVAVHGLLIEPLTVDSQITYADLDMYATAIILGLGNFLRKMKTWGCTTNVFVPVVNCYGGVSYVTRPRIGDRVSFTEYTGATPEEYQIVAVTIDEDQQTVQMELGDFEMNVFTSLIKSTNALDKTFT